MLVASIEYLCCNVGALLNARTVDSASVQRPAVRCIQSERLIRNRSTTNSICSHSPPTNRPVHSDRCLGQSAHCCSCFVYWCCVLMLLRPRLCLLILHDLLLIYFVTHKYNRTPLTCTRVFVQKWSPIPRVVTRRHKGKV